MASLYARFLFDEVTGLIDAGGRFVRYRFFNCVAVQRQNAFWLAEIEFLKLIQSTRLIFSEITN